MALSSDRSATRRFIPDSISPVYFLRQLRNAALDHRVGELTQIVFIKLLAWLIGIGLKLHCRSKIGCPPCARIFAPSKASSFSKQLSYTSVRLCFCQCARGILLSVQIYDQSSHTLASKPSRRMDADQRLANTAFAIGNNQCFHEVSPSLPRFRGIE